MKLGILHLSDIHIKNKEDKVLGKAAQIAAACYNTAKESDLTLITITGDIAYSGSKEQYELAETLLKEIQSYILDESGKSPEIIVTPGNHDCILIPETLPRKLAIRNIVANPEEASDPEAIEICTAVQENFFLFRKNITRAKPIFEDKLWCEYEIDISGNPIRISAINAAWMSRIPETQGELVFPIDNYIEIIEAPSNLRISLIHHPLNWYCQASYHPLKKTLRTHSNVILSGHEHSFGSEEVIDSENGSILIFEAPALQPHDEQNSECSCLLFNIHENTVVERRFSVSGATPQLLKEEIVHQLKISEQSLKGKYRLLPAFVETLSDPGGNFTHPERNKILAEDVFLYPELKDNTGEEESKTIYADKIIQASTEGDKTLLLGEDEAGKTFLLKRIFLDLHNQGLIPLYIKATDLTSVSDRELDKKIAALAENQYCQAEEINYAPKKNKIAIVDDIDRISGGARSQLKLIQHLEKNFSSIYVTANSRYQISELVDVDAAESLADFLTYTIRPFGLSMRHKLIKKWCLLGDVSTKTALDARVHDVERLITTIIGKNLIPAKPIYLLILLQSSEQKQQGELQNSSFSHYYEYLIVKSLKEAGFRADRLNEMFNYLANLAWEFKERNSKELSTNEFKEFNSKFSSEYTSVDFEPRIEILTKSKILLQNGGGYKFNYSYIYYLFIGKYLADNLHKDSIKEKITEYCLDLHKRENANSIMFLTHHRNDPWVVEQITDNLKTCFSDKTPLELNGDVKAINEFVETASQLLIEEIDVDRNQEQQRELADTISENESDEQAEQTTSGTVNDALSLTSKLHKLTKTSEILGLITRNYYGSIERSRKNEYLKQIFDGTLRSLKAIFSGIEEQPEAFISELERAIEEARPGLTADQRVEHAKKFAFQITGLICTGFIAKSAQFVSSEKIREDIFTLVNENPTNSYRLIGAATYLTQPGNLPFTEIDNLAKALKDNPFAFTILQSLVFYHLHMFHTSESDKQRLASLVKISLSQSRAIDLKTRKSKLIKSN
ncbi:MAG: metallophosphoesterase [Pseudomonas sp.]|uniref:STAND family AAA ATPase n=1 Tax=Pseudomonas sp. TaxID=306 RepID=UPI003982D50A